MKKLNMILIFNILMCVLISGCSTSKAEVDSAWKIVGSQYIRDYSPVKGPSDAEITIVDFSGFL